MKLTYVVAMIIAPASAMAQTPATPPTPSDQELQAGAEICAKHENMTSMHMPKWEAGFEACDKITSAWAASQSAAAAKRANDLSIVTGAAAKLP